MKSKGTTNSKRPAWLVKALIAALIVLLAGGGAAWYFLDVKAKAQAQSTTTEKTYTSTVTKGTLQVSATGSGTLIANQAVDLAFTATGKVTVLNVALGDTVKAGDVLAQLDSAKNLEADVAAAQVSLIEAQQTLNTLQKEANVSLAQAYQDLLTAQTTYDDAVTANSKTTGRRCSQEVTAKYSAAYQKAQDKVNNLHAEDPNSDPVITAKNDLATAQANYNYCAAYTTTEKTTAKADVDVAKNKLDQAQLKYDTLKANSGVDPDAIALNEAKVKSAKTALETAQTALDGIVLKAPIDGKVTYLASAKDTIVTEAVKYITVSDISKPTLTVSVDETDLDKLVEGNAATVTFDALDGQTFTGKVSQADAALTSSGQYRVAKGQVQLDSATSEAVQKLPLGVSATVTLIAQEAKDALLIPVEALKDLGGNTYAVMLKGSDGQLKLQTVEIGIKDSSSVVITSGLKEGDIVSTGTTQAIKTSSSADKTGTQQQGGDMMPPGGMPPQ